VQRAVVPARADARPTRELTSGGPPNRCINAADTHQPCRDERQGGFHGQAPGL